jgi:tRNA-uridine 2-sulfurtransferase
MSKKTVVVAMSGGVDSSLAAALLKEEGYNVIGVTMQIWDPEKPEAGEDHGGCCSLSAVDDARRVANTLEIPYYVMNFRDLFETKVINYFIDEYLEGKTPNPCIACNRFIKFESFLQKAQGLGADFIATGHYAKLGFDEKYQRYVMQKAIDDTKDQTYALYTLTQEQLAHTLMPLGKFRKVDIRKMAEELGLTVANKPDSQEICFVTDNNYKGFIKENTTKTIKPGNFVDTHGNILGKHEGIPFYTIGQRKGLGIALGEPMYVVRIDPVKNHVVLGKHEEVFNRELISKDNNFILIDKLVEPMEVEAKIRYSAKPAKSLITPIDGERVKVEFEQPQRASTPGQAVVFYKDDYVVGGGTIEVVK